MEGVVPAVGSGTSVSRASPASIGLRAAAAILAQRSMLACPSQRPGHCCEPGISGRDPKQPALQVPVAPSGHPGAGRLAGLPEAPAPPSPFSTPASPMSTEVLTGAPPTSPAPLREGVGLCLRRCPPERQAPSRPPEPRHAPRRDPRPSDGQRSRWGGVAPEAAIAGPSGARVLKDAIAYAASKGVTVVASAGNDGRSSVSFPAACPEVIAVGAVSVTAPTRTTRTTARRSTSSRRAAASNSTRAATASAMAYWRRP